MRRRDDTCARRPVLPLYPATFSKRSILFAFTKEPLARAVYDYEHDMIDS